MNTTIEVKLWGKTVGYIGYSPDQTEVATFEYANDFINTGIQISPIKMPSTQTLHTFDDISKRTFKGVAGVFADSLPDTFGNQLIDLFMLTNNIQNVTTLNRLTYVANRSMGALEYHPFNATVEASSNNSFNIELLSELAELVINNKKEFTHKLANSQSHEEALKLIRVGSSAGGARSKALVAIDKDNKLYDGTVDQGINFSYWLLKFDTSNNKDRDNTDPKGMTKVEYIYSLIARICTIEMPQTRFIQSGNDFHFLIERFDRLVGSTKVEKLHYASWSGLDHADRDTAGAYSYEQLIVLARRLKLKQKSITELYKRAIFNIVGRNQDDHTKNFGFLMNKKGEWRLSPAFDLTYSYDPSGKWTRQHQIRLNRKQDNFTMEDLLTFGQYCDVPNKKALGIIEETIQAFKMFKGFAKEYKVDDALANTISQNLRLRF